MVGGPGPRPGLCKKDAGGKEGKDRQRPAAKTLSNEELYWR